MSAEKNTPLLEFKHVTVRRGGRTALNDVSLQINLGENVALMGPNASGKSRVLKLITRECYPVDHPQRVFRIGGESRWNIFELRHLLGIVSTDWQEKFDRELTGLETVLSGFFSSVGIWPADRVTPEMERKAKDILAFLGVPHLERRWMTEMSSGEARRILIGRALVHDPKVLVLDEPSNSLDVKAVREFQETLRRIAQSGKNILMATHHLHDVIPEMQRVVLLQEGKILRDGPKSAVFEAATLSTLFQTPLALDAEEGYYSWRSVPVR